MTPSSISFGMLNMVASVAVDAGQKITLPISIFFATCRAHANQKSTIRHVTLLSSCLLIVSISCSNLVGIDFSIDSINLPNSFLSSHGSNPSGMETICIRSSQPSFSNQFFVMTMNYMALCRGG
ncbi:hypothetical protein HanIR_Chr15g0743041 [Helianthus annuus]|nr:hypothetical protein HanIR_Chr15g0743041 [Helianthus annuus]